MKNSQTIIKQKFKEDRPKSELSCRNGRMKKQNKTGRFLFRLADEKKQPNLKKIKKKWRSNWDNVVIVVNRQKVSCFY